ncbi:MAG: hypothetical protein QOI62_3004 [Solirubrobacteraceae bacterium]|jgi:hypothetical protein|nr:hypothetical protein [Solirubrobacteraceae bacterium]
MSRKQIPFAGALLAGAALAIPAPALADGPASVASVKAHTVRADRSLQRAVTQFQRHDDAAAARLLSESRSELAAARRDGERLRTTARTDAQRDRAVRARAIVARVSDRNVDRLASVLPAADGRAERQVARALLADTVGRDEDIAVLKALLDRGVSEEGAARIAGAVGELVQDRDREVGRELDALGSDEVAPASKRVLSRAVERNVDGQHDAARELAELIDGPDVPANAKQGLRAAYQAVVEEQIASAELLARCLQRVPPEYRGWVQRVQRDATAGGQDLQASRPDGAGQGDGSGDAPRPTGGESRPTGTGTGGGSPTGTGTPDGGPTASPAPGGQPATTSPAPTQTSGG